MKPKLSAIKSARRYIEKGYRVVPIPSGKKAPNIPDWQKLELSESEIEEYFSEDSNIGVLLGEPSRNLVDVDLDCPEAIRLAPDFLPTTGRIHGRKSRSRSHWWYKADSPLKPEKYSFEGECLLEIRSTGQQTLVPPSIHPSGERLQWEEAGKAARVHIEELIDATRRLAAAALLARKYPSKGSRNDFALALAGTLQRAGWEEMEIGDFVATVAQAADDEEWRARKAAARSTRMRMEKGGSATGRPRLSKLIGRGGVDRVCEWLGISNFSPLVSKAVHEPIDWPKPLSEAAYYGPVGEIVKGIEPETEADPAAMLVQFQVAFGNCVGASPYCVADGSWQRPNVFCIVVGQTSKARKGTSLAHVRRVMERVDPRWGNDRIINGLSSGEGLIKAVEDSQTDVQRKRGASKTEGHEVKDKRALVCEAEFSSVLRRQRREYNSLSSVIRQAWDSDTLQTLTKNSPLKASAAHISIIGHITQEELRRELSAADEANGYANRFLFVCATRSKELPMGGKIEPRMLFEFSQKLRSAMTFAHTVREVKFSTRAERLWRKRYSELSAARPGMLGAITSRGEAQVLRLALIYALQDRRSEIRTQHLKAAFEVWRYCMDSAEYIFGKSSGDPVAEKILRALNRTPRGLSRTDIRNLLGRNVNKHRTNIALGFLKQLQLAKRVTEETGGRPAKRWFATRAHATP